MNNICPGCGAGYNVTPQHVGRQLACKKCGAMLVVKADGLHLATAEPVVSAPEPAPREREPEYDSDDDFGAERAFRRGARSARGGGSAVADFLSFRRMIVPIMIQILFWLGVLASIVGGIMLIAGGNAEQVVYGILALFLGPLVVRIYCELLIVVFRVNETLTDVRTILKEWKK